MTKVEQFEVIRREHLLYGKSIRVIAEEQGVHRRAVRQAIASSVPPPRKVVTRSSPVLTAAIREVIEA